MKNNTFTRIAAIAALACSAGAQAATPPTVVDPADWSTMISVGSGGTLSYLFNVTSGSPLSLSATLVPAISSGNFGSAGYMKVVTALEPQYGPDGSIVFYRNGASSFNLLIGGQGVHYWNDLMGSYTPGASYDLTMTWDRANNLIDITLGSFSKTVSSTGHDILGIEFSGPQIGGAAQFGNLVVNTQPVPEPATWLMLAVGLATVGSLRRRRQPAA